MCLRDRSCRRVLTRSSVLKGCPVTRGEIVELGPQLAVLVVTEGAGQLAWDGGTLPLAAGGTVLVPFGAGTVRVSGEFTAIRGLPPVA